MLNFVVKFLCLLTLCILHDNAMYHDLDGKTSPLNWGKFKYKIAILCKMYFKYTVRQIC